MCVDSLLLKFNSDEKQLIRLFIPVFTSDCILRRTNNHRRLCGVMDPAQRDHWNDCQLSRSSLYVSDTAQNDFDPRRGFL